MKASIIIPVWNGASVITDCLQALYAHCGEELLEVICIDNASSDDSATLIEKSYPKVRLMRQPINLGFAGGVNAGIDAAGGDVFIMLNQDCIVGVGWLTALMEALGAYPQYGIIGSTTYNADGTLNHTGAMVRRSDAQGIHLTETTENQVHTVDFATGAATAIRRQAWKAVGRFDEGFYPAYYEDADFCYRARRLGIESGCATAAQAVHLFSSREAHTNPIGHTRNHHVVRYRFVCKHFTGHEIESFFEAEQAALSTEEFLTQALGRIIAARHTLHTIPDILERRRLDMETGLSAVERRTLQVGLTQIIQQAFRIALTLTSPELPGRQENLDNIAQQLRELEHEKHELLNRIYFRSPSDQTQESTLQRFTRVFFKRLPSLISGREHLLWTRLYSVLDQRLERMGERAELMHDLSNERIKLLETLTEYDYWYR